MEEINRDGYPIEINPRGVILDGHHRYQALKALVYSDSEIKRLFTRTITDDGPDQQPDPSSWPPSGTH